MKMKQKIETIMFEDLKQRFPDHNYNLDFYQEIMESPSVNALLDLAGSVAKFSKFLDLV